MAITSSAASGKANAAARRILVHGHRGARAVLPENTMPAFEYAASLPVDVLELDMAVTKDNVVVVSHDAHINPVICEGPKPKAAIRSLTLDELRAYDCGARKNPDYPKQQPKPGTRIPTLDEVFGLAKKGKFDFNIETKIFAKSPELTPPPEEFARLVLEVVRKHKLESRVILQSFDFRTLHAMKKLAPEIRRSALFPDSPLFNPMKSFVAVAEEAEATIVSPHFRVVTNGKVREAQAKGLQVVPWTANKPAEWDKLVAAGVDAIISDDPAELLDYLRAKGLH